MGNMEAEERKEEGTPSGETLEAAFGKLDQMLETLESSDVSLEDSFRLYKEGMELLNECSQKIDRVEKKMLQMNEEHSENFKAVLEEKTREAESIIAAYLPKEEGFAKELAKAMNYSMTAGGKRLRPLLLQESFRLFGGTGEAVKPFMAAMEMIHTHSLIHDDLPAIDNDDYRRGRKTTHVVFGEAVGVLAGDALLNYAYETAWKAFPLEEHTDRVVRAFGILCQKTGISGMLGGQSVDVMNEKAGHFAIDREMLDYIYENKTSALLEAAMMAGAALAGANDDDLDALCRIASKVGIAFQIRDDILDVTSTMEELGKPVFSDEKNEKTTYVTLFGTDGAEQEVKRLTKEAVDELKNLSCPRDKIFLEELFESLTSRKK